MRCDECKHWSPDEVSERKRVEGMTVRICKRAPAWWDATEWDYDREDPDTCEPIRSLKEELRGTKMFVQDGSDYRAYLYTAADFFCAHHEPST